MLVRDGAVVLSGGAGKLDGLAERRKPDTAQSEDLKGGQSSDELEEVSGQTDDVRIAEAETIAEMLQAFVDERRALEAERDYWHSRALQAEAELAEQRNIAQSRPNATRVQENRRRLRGNWLDNR
jgi:hypothetical protein